MYSILYTELNSELLDVEIQLSAVTVHWLRNAAEKNKAVYVNIQKRAQHQH